MFQVARLGHGLRVPGAAGFGPAVKGFSAWFSEVMFPFGAQAFSALGTFGYGLSGLSGLGFKVWAFRMRVFGAGLMDVWL